MIEISATTEKGNGNEENHEEERLFDPPLYKQRYHAISNLINGAKATKVLDMGCSEGQFLPVIKSMCPDVEEIYGIDIDRSLLERMKFRLQPLTIEYVLKRDKPLTMSFLHGSITQPDLRYVDMDFVACIEVIEHLHVDDLNQVPRALFGLLRPKCVAITTPNSEYNVLFKDFSGMRHWDHKFEWTRQEFENWCLGIVDMFPYKVEFSGIGDPPADRQDVGCCSQMAVFTRQQNCERLCENIKQSVFEEIHTVNYPCDLRDRKSKILNEIQYLINRFYSNEEDEGDAEEIVRYIPLDELFKFSGFSNLDVSKTEVVDILQNNENYELSETSEEIVVRFKRSDFEKYWSDDDSFDDNCFLGDNAVECTLEGLNIAQEEEEDWG